MSGNLIKIIKGLIIYSNLLYINNNCGLETYFGQLELIRLFHQFSKPVTTP